MFVRRRTRGENTREECGQHMLPAIVDRCMHRRKGRGAGYCAPSTTRAGCAWMDAVVVVLGLVASGWLGAAKAIRTPATIIAATNLKYGSFLMARCWIRAPRRRISPFRLHGALP